MRIALFSRRIAGRERIWVATGVAGAIGLARGPALALLVLAAGATGACLSGPCSCWPRRLPVGALVAYVARRWTPHARVAHVLDAFGALGGSPRAAGAVLGWVGARHARARVGRGVAVCCGARRGRSRARRAGDDPCAGLAGTVPITPGNIGVGSGAVAVALP